VETRLLGDSSESKIVGAFFGHEDQHFDLASRVWHEAEHTTADLITRGVLDDAARSVYEGRPDVGREAWDTNSYQRENTLMLSEDSEADASPKLIINNHDTEASHSATVGQVDEEDLFYMTSRGVHPELARNMLVEGLLRPRPRRGRRRRTPRGPRRPHRRAAGRVTPRGRLSAFALSFHFAPLATLVKSPLQVEASPDWNRDRSGSSRERCAR